MIDNFILIALAGCLKEDTNYTDTEIQVIVNNFKDLLEYQGDLEFHLTSYVQKLEKYSVKEKLLVDLSLIRMTAKKLENILKDG